MLPRERTYCLAIAAGKVNSAITRMRPTTCMRITTVIATKHKPYFRLNLKKVKSLMRTPIIVDGRNVLDRVKAERAGFLYKGIGKG